MAPGTTMESKCRTFGIADTVQDTSILCDVPGSSIDSPPRRLTDPQAEAAAWPRHIPCTVPA
jgi:hypothetical protein